MGNKKVLSKATRELNKTKRFAAPKNIIEDPRGQWAHPGEITRIPSDRITMQGVPYPVMAYPNMGEPQMMYPGQDYVFPGADYVDEYPQMKRGGTPKSLVKMPKPSKKGLASKKFSRSLEATNRLFTENPLFAKPKSKKRKVFDPNAYYQDGGLMTQEEIDGATEGMMKARLAYAQMHGNPAAQRMVVAPDQPYVFDHGDTGTHFMASMDNYAVPLIQDVNGQLMLGDFGPESAEAMRFDNPEDAMYFAEHYKEITPDESYRKQYPEEDYVEAELTPEEIEEYQMGGYIVEDVDDTDSPAAPCPPGKIYDPIIQGCVDESVYRLNRQVQKDSINVDDAIRENRRYYKGYKFIQDWQNSPMYDKMLKESARSPESYEYMKKMRQQQLESTPPLQILPQPEDSPNTGGYSMNATGQIVILPEGFHTRGTHSHEVSHSSDRPVRGKRSRLIPQRDIDYINKNKAKTFGDSREYHNDKDQYDQFFKEYPGYREDVDSNFREFSTDYVGEPTEVRARLNAIRQLSKEAGLYDPLTQGVSPDLYYKKLKNYQFEKGDKSGFDPMQQLQNAFSDEEIIWLLNNMSKTEDNKQELNVAQEGGSPDPKTNFYTVEGSGGVYRKVNGRWEVDWNRSGKFQPLSKGDVKKRAAVLDKKAKPLYDATYDDLYATQRSAYTAPAKSTPAKKPTAQDKAAQEQFDKNFQVTGKSKMEVVEDKIQKTADDYAKYHQQQTGKPLTQEEYDDAYQDIYNRAYVDAGVYKPTMSGPTINPYGTTEERKNLVSLDPGKAPKNLTLGDYVDKGWDVVTNPLDYASYALKPKGTVTTPWNMTNYENRLEAAGLEDPVTANNNVNKAIDFASYFIGPGMVAQGLKMVPGTVNSIGRAFENPSWENTGDALFDAGMTALSIAPGFGIAKNLAKPASTLDDLKAIEALRGNTATTPFQSYYLTGNRALGTSEAAVQQAEALRKFTGQQPLELPAGEYQFSNSDYKKLYDELQEAIKKQKIESDELANFDPIAKINESKVDNKTFKDLIMGDDLKFKFDDYPDSPRIPVRYAGLEQIRPGSGISLNLAADTPGQLPSLTRTPKEMKAIDDLRKLHSRTRTGQSNAEDVFNRLKTQKLKDLDTPDGRRRIQEHIDDNNIMKSDYVESNYDEISKRYDLRDILTNPNHEKHQVAVEGLKEELIRKGKNPSDYKLNSWDELTGDAVLSNMRLYLDADEVVAKSYPDYFGGFIERPITTDEYIDRIKLLDYSNPEKDIKLIENKIASEKKRIPKVKAKKDELLKDYQKGDVSLDRYRKIKSEQEAEILRAEQEIISMEMTIYWLKKDLERNNASYNFGPHTIGIGDPLTAIGDLERAVYHEVGHGTDLAFLKAEKEGSKIDRDLLDEVVLAKEAPAHISQKLDLDAMSQASPYTTSRFSIMKAQNPIAYWEQARNYFKGAEPTAFVVELRPLLKEAGLIKNDFDKVTPEMVKELYLDYITKPVWETGTRIFDIIKPVEQSFKAISKALNKIKGMAPYAIPVGLGVGATGLAGQEEMQQDMEYQDGGIIMELSDDEIQQYANGGFVVEELEYRPDAGKTLNKKVAAKPKTTINTEGLAYRPSASTKPQNPNAKANVQTNPSQQRQQNVQVPKPKVITDSMSTVLDKYAIGDTSPIMSIDVFQDIVTKQNQEKQAKLEILQRQLEASQAGTSSPNPAKRKQPSITQYEFTEEFIKGMPNVRTEQSESYLGGRPLKNEVKKVVLHHTGSTDEKNNNKYVHNHFMNPDSETSAHVVIEEDGTRTIYASPDQVTFHAGKSTWDGRTNVNDFGVGIEFQGDTNVKPLTSAQIRSFVEYFDQLAKKYNVSTQDIITHAMIAPGRKPDITESQYKRILKYLKERGYE